MKKYFFIFVTVAYIGLTLNGCGYLIVGGAGAAAGYIAKDNGYEVQSPITKAEKTEDQQKSTPQEKSPSAK